MSVEIVLTRVALTHQGTFGVLTDNGIPFALTCEDPWNDNLRNISCIPTGVYVCQRVDSPRFGWTFEVIGVPNRSHILFHKGNTPEDTRGCILVGSMFGKLKGKPAVLMSNYGFGKLMSKLSEKVTFTLIIREV